MGRKKREGDRETEKSEWVEIGHCARDHGKQSELGLELAPVLLEPLAQLGNVLHCPVNATTHDAKVLTREGSEDKSETA